MARSFHRPRLAGQTLEGCLTAVHGSDVWCDGNQVLSSYSLPRPWPFKGFEFDGQWNREYLEDWMHDYRDVDHRQAWEEEDVALRMCNHVVGNDRMSQQSDHSHFDSSYVLDRISVLISLPTD